MIPAEFDYVKAGSVEEAVAALPGGDDAKVITGGQSLLPAPAAAQRADRAGRRGRRGRDARGDRRGDLDPVGAAVTTTR